MNRLFPSFCVFIRGKLTVFLIMLFLIPVIASAAPIRIFLGEIIESLSRPYTDQNLGSHYRDIFARNFNAVTELMGDKSIPTIVLENNLQEICGKCETEINQIRDFLKDEFKKVVIPHILSQGGFSTTTPSSLIKQDALEFIGKLPIHQRRPIFDLISDATIERTRLYSTQIIDNVKIEEVPYLPSLVNDLPDSTLSAQLQKQTLTTAVRYIQNAPRDRKASMIGALLTAPPETTPGEKLTMILQKSGPLFQKLFQLVGQDIPNKEFNNITQKLLSEISPLPFSEVQKIIENRLGTDFSRTISEINPTPLGTASIGQVHLGRTVDGREIVIKIRKPGIEKTLKQELALLKKITRDFSGFQNIVNSLETSTLEELDFRIEARNVKKGSVYRNYGENIDIADTVSGLPPFEDILFSEKAPGVSLSKLSDYDLIRQGNAISQLLQGWFEESMFRSGFFHGDLHPGNIFITDSHKNPKSAKVTLIDFGHCGELKISQRRAIALLLWNTVIKSVDGVHRTMSSLADFSSHDTQKIKQMYADILAKPKLSPMGRIDQILNITIQHGIPIPREFTSFFRGKAFLESKLRLINERLDQIDPKKKAPRFHKDKIYSRSIWKYIATNVLQMFFKPKNAHEQIINWDMIWTAFTEKNPPSLPTSSCEDLLLGPI